jgi:hypothetical protein
MSTNEERSRDKIPWWDRRDRHCIDSNGKPIREFADLQEYKPTRHKRRNMRAKELQALCLSCPVLRECRIEFLSNVQDWEHHGVTAAYIGKW